MPNHGDREGQRGRDPKQMAGALGRRDGRKLRGGILRLQFSGTAPPPVVDIRIPGRDEIALTARYALDWQILS